MSFDIILPFLRPIAHLIQDPDVSEIMVNGDGRVPPRAARAAGRG
jgi:Flp pilus assembly CpaF family ATPase